MPQDVRERILAVQEKSGFVSNLFLALAHQAAEFRASLAYHDALIEEEGGLSKTERHFGHQRLPVPAALYEFFGAMHLR